MLQTMSGWIWASGALVLAACSSDGNAPMVCHCPAGVFLVSIPADRTSDVESVTATGACSNASPSGKGGYSVSEDSVGTCHIAVTFQSGAPEFDTDVPLARGTFECEASCAPTTSSPVVVPELDGDGGIGGAQ